MHGISLQCRHMPIFIFIAYSSVITIKISFKINIPPIPCFVSTFSFKEKIQATKCPREYSGDYICTLINCMLTTQLPRVRFPSFTLSCIDVYSFPFLFLEIKRKETLQSPYWPGQSPYPLSEWRVLIEHDSQNLNPEAKEIIFGATQFSWNTVKRKVELAEVSIFTEQT